MSRSDKGDRPRKRFLHTLGRGASFFLLIYARRKLQPSLGNQKSSYLIAGSFYASGTLPRSKNRPLDCFCPAGRTAGLRLAVTASACPPWAGLALCDRAAPALALCFRRRRRSPPQQAILVPNGAQTAVSSKTSNKKIPRSFVRGILWCTMWEQTRTLLFVRAASASHDCSPGSDAVVPPREDKRGVLKYQGAFAAYPRSTNWAAVFHSPLDISPFLFFWLIAEQPTSPYPDWIT